MLSSANCIVLAVPHSWTFVTRTVVEFAARENKSRLGSCVSLAISLGLATKKAALPGLVP